MIWEDMVLMCGGFGFSLALLPSVIKKTPMPILTPLITAVILTSYLAVYFSLELWLGFISGALTAAMWWFLLYIAVKKRG